jgi:[ribosomal protein S5]-alanine N-acetyltransferase
MKFWTASPNKPDSKKKHILLKGKCLPTPICQPLEIMNNLPRQFATTSLHLQSLAATHAPFILELLNSPGWLTYIGNRNIHNLADAANYIEKIKAMEQVHYWVVQQHPQQAAMGVVTLIKRPYLPHPDIGFAFLPAYQGRGYAGQAVQLVLQYLLSKGIHSTLLATTLPTNTASIKLLLKLGFQFQSSIVQDGIELQVYVINATDTPIHASALDEKQAHG